MGETTAPWWKGARGEWYIVAQVALIALVLSGPPTLAGWRPIEPMRMPLLSIPGMILMLAGMALIVAGAWNLGRNRGLTPLPYPTDRGALVQTGPYAVVRHPMYSGGILLAYGWALLVHGPLTALYATLLLVFVDVKSRREERWLRDRHPEYEAYQRRVRKLIPLIY